MDDVRKKETLLVALGGNALIKKGQVGTVEEQFQNLKEGEYDVFVALWIGDSNLMKDPEFPALIWMVTR